MNKESPYFLGSELGYKLLKSNNGSSKADVFSLASKPQPSLLLCSEVFRDL